MPPTTKTRSVKIPHDLHKFLRVWAAKRGLKLSEAMEILVKKGAAK